MGIEASIRTPAEVIALAIEDAGLDPKQAKVAAEDAARRLARCLKRLSEPKAIVVLNCHTGEELSWGTVHTQDDSRKANNG